MRNKKRKREHKISKKESLELWKQGCALIDTSGRTRRFTEKSVIALASKDHNFTCFFPANVKKTIHNSYSKHYGEENFICRLHAIGLYLCLEKHIELIPCVYICSDGHNGSRITHHLKNLMKDKFDSNKVHILPSLKKSFGKKNQADRLAASVRKGSNPSMKLNTQILEKFFEKK